MFPAPRPKITKPIVRGIKGQRPSVVGFPLDGCDPINFKLRQDGEKHANVVRRRNSRDREELSTIMARIREWLDSQRFEPDAFRCTTDEETVICRLEF